MAGPLVVGFSPNAFSQVTTLPSIFLGEPPHHGRDLFTPSRSGPRQVGVVLVVGVVASDQTCRMLAGIGALHASEVSYGCGMFMQQLTTTPDRLRR
jgi:hypothetical protein